MPLVDVALKVIKFDSMLLFLFTITETTLPLTSTTSKTGMEMYEFIVLLSVSSLIYSFSESKVKFVSQRLASYHASNAVSDISSRSHKVLHLD